MKHRSLKWTAVRLRFVPVQTLLYRFCWAIVLVSIVLSVEGLLPPSALAQNTPINAVLSGNQVASASNIVTPTVQMPPSAVNRLRQALSKQTKIPAAKLKLVETAPKTWTDGCLGLARSGEICTQALVKGWRVVFSDGSKRWAYRTDQRGNLYRLEP